ncbi:MAG: OmpA family protein [Gammaproteobacteria bacterium SHHR-1]|uniref:OmpA family protein n=1 Tax=Magnetovirga frankeli TaxID=947516 RepID=UPI001293153F|nr:OmpA family protein [gamma proteobacterium SS-5]
MKHLLATSGLDICHGSFTVRRFVAVICILLLFLLSGSALAVERNVRSTYGKAVTSAGECVKSIAGGENLCIKDSDGDGVFDDKDKCPNTPKGYKVDANGCILEITVPDLFFDFNKASLKPGFIDMLRGLQEEYRGQMRPEAIRVTGHTDSIGSDAYNQKLSLRRAEAVKDALIGLGIDGGIIHTQGAGESAPIADNETEEGRARNRRVQIDIQRPAELIGR